MNFVRFVQTRLEMYAASIGWRALASMSTDWCPYPLMGVGGNLWVTVRDALMHVSESIYSQTWKIGLLKHP